MLLVSERRVRNTLVYSIEISLYLLIFLFIYEVRRTSSSARASNYVKWAE